VRPVASKPISYDRVDFRRREGRRREVPGVEDERFGGCVVLSSADSFTRTGRDGERREDAGDGTLPCAVAFFAAFTGGGVDVPRAASS
jgi:hypothetical protein